MSAPVIETPRLRLRGHVFTDMSVLWAFYQSDRAAHMDAPDNPGKFWYGFLAENKSWEENGFGALAIELQDGTFIGQITLGKPVYFPELELGWLLFDGFEGQGYAREAAEAALNWVWASLNEDTLVSYVAPDNARSAALAQKLGAVPDPDAPLPEGADPSTTQVFRYHRPTRRAPEVVA